MKKSVLFSVIVLGITAISSQIIFMREFMVIFYGNELSTGIVLACWLIWTATGSRVAASFLRSRSPFSITIPQFLLAILIPATLIIIRISKSVMGFAVGEMVDFFSMSLAVFIITAPVCFLCGFLFVAACRLHGRDGAAGTGRVYFYEAAGSIIGGVLTSFLALRYLHSIYTAAFLSFLNITSAVLAVMFLCVPGRLRRIMSTVLTGAGLLFIVFLCMGAWQKLDNFSVFGSWRGYEVVSLRNTAYGNIVVADRGGEKSVFYNGQHLFTEGDTLSAEEAVHFAMLENPGAKEVLVIGAASALMFEEILKYGVNRIDYAQLDPEMIDITRSVLATKYRGIYGNGKINIFESDGRYYLRHTDRKYGVIILCVGQPLTARINRYYTREFFGEVKTALKKDGVFSFSLPAAENYIGEDLRRLLSSVYYTLKSVFDGVVVVPGDTAHFIASPEKGVITADYRELEKRIEERGLSLDFVNGSYLFDRMSDYRIKYIKSALADDTGVRFNGDFLPVSYYYDIMFWSSHFSGSIARRVLNSAGEINIWITALSIYLIIILSSLIAVKRRGAFRGAVLLSVFTTGFSEISFQIMVILAFQIIYGALFLKLGLILTSFMAGLALGGYFITKKMDNIKDPFLSYLWVQSGASVYPVFLIVIFSYFANAQSPVALWIGANIVFVFVPVLAGFIGGVQFPLANKLCIKDDAQSSAVAGSVYSMDLLGSCLGALVTAVILVPVLGVFKTCIVTAFLNLSVLLLLRIAFAGAKR